MVGCGYLAALAVAGAISASLFSGPLVVLATVGLAALLAVPAAVLVTVAPADTLTSDLPTLPVLRRPSSGDGPAIAAEQPDPPG